MWGNFQQIFGGGLAETKTGFCLSSKRPDLQPKKEVVGIISQYFFKNIIKILGQILKTFLISVQNLK